MTIPRQRDRDWPVDAPPLSRDVFRGGLTMPCDIEKRVASHRRAAWHKDCPYPSTCPCPHHTLAEVAP